MTRTPPDEDEYTVVGCSDCDNLQIVQGAPKTTECKRCGRQLTFKKLKQFYRTTDKDGARNARALKLAARAGNEDQFKQLLKSGALDEADARAVTDKEYLKKLGFDPTIADDESDAPSPAEAVQEALVALDEPTTETIVSHVTESEPLSEDQIYDAVEKLQRRGDIIKRPDGTVTLV